VSQGRKITAITPKPAEKAQPVTPLEMLNRAVQSGADIAILERLMDLHSRWEKDQARKAFEAAIADAKAEIKPIRKNRKVDFTSAKGRTNYDYEDLAEIDRTIAPILARHGLSYRHRSRQDGKKLTIVCIVSHRDGHFEETELSAENDESGNKNSIQAVGSTATFLQRYTLKLALGLAASKDDDGKAAGKAAGLNEEQIAKLQGLLTETQSDEVKFRNYLAQKCKREIETLADIPANMFDSAIRVLEAKRVAE
jgi:hypothetical protein